MVRLWDSRSYCRDCVEAVCPKLFPYAMGHSRLEESAPFGRGAYWRNAWRREAWIFLFFAVVFGAIGYARSGLTGTIVGIVLAMLGTTIQAAIQLPMYAWMTRLMMPSVSVADGLVTLRRAACKKCSPSTVPLQDLQWRLGHSRQDTALRNTLIPKRPVVLLVLGRSPWILFGEVRVACGWTDETRRLWTAFLTLAGVPESPRKGPWGRR